MVPPRDGTLPAAVTSTTARITIDDYPAHAFPPRTQLVAGVVVIVNEPSLRHNRIAAYLYDSLADWARATAGRGETGQPVLPRSRVSLSELFDRWPSAVARDLALATVKIN